MSRLWQIDALRAAAILAVLTYHFLSLEVDGAFSVAVRRSVGAMWCGVDLFFVISGFLITGILLETRDHPKRLRLFFARRTLRIFPLYFFWLGVVFVVHRFAPRPTIESLEPIAPWLWTYTYNVWIGIHGEFAASDRLNHLWTLALEEQFYLLWPWLVFFVPLRWFVGVTLGLIVVAQALKVVWFFDSVPWCTAYTALPTRMDSLMVGALAAHLWRHHRDEVRLARGARIVTGLGIVAISAIVAMQGHLYLGDVTVAFGTSALAWTFGGLTLTALTMPALREEPRWIGPVRFIATISYGMYVSHWILRCALIDYGWLPDGVGGFGRFLLLSCATIVISWAVYRAVELPFLDLKRFFRYRQSPAVADAAGSAPPSTGRARRSRASAG